jgi:hypothetical protein
MRPTSLRCVRCARVGRALSPHDSRTRTRRGVARGRTEAVTRWRRSALDAVAAGDVVQARAGSVEERRARRRARARAIGVAVVGLCQIVRAAARPDHRVGGAPIDALRFDGGVRLSAVDRSGDRAPRRCLARFGAGRRMTALVLSIGARHPPAEVVDEAKRPARPGVVADPGLVHVVSFERRERFLGRRAGRSDARRCGDDGGCARVAAARKRRGGDERRKDDKSCARTATGSVHARACCSARARVDAAFTESDTDSRDSLLSPGTRPRRRRRADERANGREKPRQRRQRGRTARSEVVKISWRSGRVV